MCTTRDDQISTRTAATLEVYSAPEQRLAADRSTTRSFEYPDSELVFGVVVAVGTDVGQLETTLTNHLRKFQYRLNSIRLSELLKTDVVQKRHGVQIRTDGEYQRTSDLMDAGNKMPEISGQPAFLALLAASQIAHKRRGKSMPAHVHLLNSLKRPEEVEALRRIYGPGFFLIGVYAPESDRKAYLKHEKDTTDAEADLLMRRDQDEEPRFGQRTRDTFHLADVFVRLEGGDVSPR